MMPTLYNPTAKVGPTPTNLPPTWIQAEEFIRDEYDLIEDHGSWHDARDQEDTPIEIKSCATKYEDGRLGRFELWQEQYLELYSEGKIALLVYRPEFPCLVIATHIVRPYELSEKGTRSSSRHPTMGWEARQRIPWPEAVPLDAILLRARNAYADHYDDDEYMEELLPLEEPGDADADPTQ